jgi:sulfur carrier protein
MSIASEKIRVTVNGDDREIEPGKTVADLLEELGLNPRLVVVEHNRVILDRSRLDQTEVRAGDLFELVHFVGGG